MFSPQKYLEKQKRRLLRSRMRVFIYLLQNIVRLSHQRSSFSQSAEDVILQTLLPEKYGYYIDIGAGNPIIASNTYVFYRRGWAGTALDPLEINQKLFMYLRPRDKFIKCIASEDSRSENFWEMEPYAYSTTNPEIVEELTRKQIAVIIREGAILSTSLRDLKIEMSPFLPTLLCVDAEGADFEILKGNNWLLTNPRVICFENSGKVNKLSIEKVAYLNSVGYSRYASAGISDIYASKAWLEKETTSRITLN